MTTGLDKNEKRRFPNLTGVTVWANEFIKSYLFTAPQTYTDQSLHLSKFQLATKKKTECARVSLNEHSKIEQWTPSSSL